MSDIKLFKFKPQSLLKKCKYVEMLRDGVKKTYNYRPKFETTVLSMAKDPKNNIEVLGFLDNDFKKIDVNFDDLLKYDYIAEQRPELRKPDQMIRTSEDVKKKLFKKEKEAIKQKEDWSREFTREEMAKVIKYQRFMKVQGGNECGIYNWRTKEGAIAALDNLINEQEFDKELVHEALRREGIDIDNLPIEEPENEADLFSTIGQAQAFIKKSPLFYDKNGIFWNWNKERFCYEMCDEVALLNGIRKSMSVDTIDSKKRTEVIAALKQAGRETHPKIKPLSWIQFKDVLVDVKNGKRINATPEYFLTNPIPHTLGKERDTPIIDRLFKEWVTKEGVQDESYFKSLKEVSAYAVVEELFMQRWFAMTGSGANGKGTWASFIRKLVGPENCAAIEIKKLATSNFALSAIYRKLVAFAGEVSYSDLTNTNNLKKLTGEDSIEYEFKGRTSFTDESITTVFVLTNSLPLTPDKSIGFYRRCFIIDFPNQFEIKPDLLNEIPEIEYENFCLEVVELLGELYKTKKFTNEGTFSEREQRYEDRSNPLPRFIENSCESVIGGLIPLQEFTSKFNEWLKIQRLRPFSVRQVGKILRNEGYEVGKRKINKENSVVAILNLEWPTSPEIQLIPEKTKNTTRTTKTTKDSSQITIGNLTPTLGSFGSSGSFSNKKELEMSDIPEDYT